MLQRLKYKIQNVSITKTKFGRLLTMSVISLRDPSTTELFFHSHFFEDLNVLLNLQEMLYAKFLNKKKLNGGVKVTTTVKLQRNHSII